MLSRLTLAVIALCFLAVSPVSWVVAAESQEAAAQAVEAVTPAAEAVAPGAEATASTGRINWGYPIVIAAGAVAGVVAINALTYSVGTIPYWIGIPTTAPMVSPAAAAASRIFVITSGVLGAWIADAVYTTSTK